MTRIPIKDESTLDDIFNLDVYSVTPKCDTVGCIHKGEYKNCYLRYGESCYSNCFIYQFLPKIELDKET